MDKRSEGVTDRAIESTEDKVYNEYTDKIKVEETRVDKGRKKSNGETGSGHKCVWASENKGSPRAH